MNGHKVCAASFAAGKRPKQLRLTESTRSSAHYNPMRKSLSSWPWQPTKRPEQHNNKDHGDHGQGGRTHNGLLAHNLASQYCGRFSNSGSLAMLMAMRRPSSRVIKFAQTDVQAHFRKKHKRARARGGHPGVAAAIFDNSYQPRDGIMFCISDNQLSIRYFQL